MHALAGLGSHPRTGGGDCPQQKRGLLDPGARELPPADGSHAAQRHVLTLPLCLLRDSAHEGELHRGRGDAQDWQAQSGTTVTSLCVVHFWVLYTCIAGARGALGDVG